MFYPCEGHRSVTPLDAARVNRTIFRNHSVSAICYYYIVARPNIYIYMYHSCILVYQQAV